MRIRQRERQRSADLGANLLQTAIFRSNLTTSLVPYVGAGGPTWSRATKAWGFNELGYLEELASGCAFFGGARLVRNTVRTTSEDFSNAAWAKNNCTVTGTNVIVCSASTTKQSINQVPIAAAVQAGQKIMYCLRVKRIAGGVNFIQVTGNSAAYGSGQYANFSLIDGSYSATGCTAKSTLVGVDTYDINISVVATNSGNAEAYNILLINNMAEGREPLFVGDGIKSFELLRAWSVDVTNYDASYVPEYVSVGVSRNEIINTEDPSNASWTMVGGIGTKTAIITDGPNGNQINVCRVTVGVSTTGLRIQGSGIVTSGAKISGSVWVRKISGSGTQVIMDLNDAGTAAFTINSVWQKIQLADISHASVAVKFIDIAISTATWTTGDIVEVCYPQYNYGSTLNDYTVVGGSYVYDGAGIDGAKYFGTDQNGLALGRDKLLGFRREAAATNNLLQSRLFQSNIWVSSPTGSELCVNGDFGASTGWTTEAGWAIGSGVLTGTATSANTYRAAGIVPGKTYTVSFEVVSRTAGLVSATIGNQSIAIWRSAAGVYTYNVIGGASGNIEVKSSGFSGVVDNISVKEAAVQCTPATGLDGIANTATTLTATAADAIILQPISLVSAARCASAYIKRRTGSGTISFTQDGGSTWTDITSLINSSTWSRVEITSTLANPSVGFKISTSGDEIDVDCVQNEAGAVATSPIVTTTAAVTRNAESLSYQTAGNIDSSVGTLFAVALSNIASATRGVVYVGSSYFGTTSAVSTTSFRINDGTTNLSKSGLSDISTESRKRAGSWGGDGLKLTGDGLAPSVGAFDGVFGDGALINIGEGLNGYIGPVAIWNYQMTDAQLQEVTK